MRKRVVLLILLLPVLSLPAEQWLLEDGASVFLPQGWLLYSRDEGDRIAFCNPEQTVIFQVTRYPGDLYDSDLTMFEEHMDALEAGGHELSRFSYRGWGCALADVSFLSGELPLRGWFLFLDGREADYYLTAFGSSSLYEETLPLILSCLDGFSPDSEGRRGPGAVGALLSSEGEERVSSIPDFRGRPLEYRWMPGREEATRLLIEREAGILSGYGDPESFDSAWKRYYRMIYREAAPDLRELADRIRDLCEGMSERQCAEAVLAWLQGFEYGSTERFSDLLSPTETLLGGRGDCDALGLVYAILMNHMGIDALLMVSRDFAHALAAVEVEGEGARVSLRGKSYVVAEMTKDVALGMIAADQADVSRWVLVDFSEYSRGTLRYEE